MASSSKYQDFILHGKKLSGSKQYNDAVQAFQSAANAASKSDQRLDAFDLQIGTMVKAKQLDDALKQAKAMIRINRRDARGYIRAAQIERLLDRPQAAAQWYSHGLKHVQSNHKHFDLLKSGLEKCESIIQQQLLLAKRCDPFTSLPLEVAQSIIQYFDYREMAAVLRVSKGWKMFMQKEEALVKTLDFSLAKRDVSIKAFKAALRRLNQYPMAVCLEKLTQPARHDVFERLPHWLRKNTIRRLHTDILFDKSLFDALPARSHLAEASLHISASQTPILLQACPALKCLTCHDKNPAGSIDWSHQSLEKLRLHYEGQLAQVAKLEMPSLRRLDASCCDFTSATNGTVPPNLLPGLSILDSLRLQRCRIPYRIGFSSTLTELSLTGMRFIDGFPAWAVFQQDLPKLRVFKANLSEWGLSFKDFATTTSPHALKQCEVLDIGDVNLDNDSVALLASMHSLRDLTIRDAYRLNGVFVKDLLHLSRGCLDRLRLVNCDRVGPDTADWASQHHSVRVEIMSEELNDGGRRIFT